MHWSDEWAAAAVGRLVSPAVDPVSGQPEFKHTVRVGSYQAAWHGFLLSRRPMRVSHANYWCKARRQAAGNMSWPVMIDRQLGPLCP